jgi:hypothetical protein
LTEGSFTSELERFDKSFWLARRVQDDGWQVMGIDAKRKVYVAYPHIKIGELGMWVIELLRRGAPWKRGESPEEFVAKMDADTQRDKDLEKARSCSEVDTLHREAWQDLQWRSGRRVTVPEAHNGWTANDRRRRFDLASA